MTDGWGDCNIPIAFFFFKKSVRIIMVMTLNTSIDSFCFALLFSRCMSEWMDKSWQ